MASSSPVLDRKVPLRSVLVLMGLAVMVTHQISHSAAPHPPPLPQVRTTTHLSNTERSDNTSVANNSLFVQQPNTELLAVLVLSRRSAFDRRAVIRDTWGKGHDNLNFFVGEHYCPLHPDERVEWTCDWNKKNVSQEAKDKYIAEELAVTGRLRKEPRVVLLPMEDYYRNLAEKVKLCYVWALEHTRSKWFLKTDDDSYVRVAMMQRALASLNESARCIVMGNVLDGLPVLRSGKWAENKYNPSTYPKLPLGSTGHIVSYPVAKYVASKASSLVNYQGEDTSLGIWLDESPLKPQIKWIRSPYMIDHKNCRDTTKYVIGHDITSDQMRACYRLGLNITTRIHKLIYMQSHCVPYRQKAALELSSALALDVQSGGKCTLDNENVSHIDMQSLYNITHGDWIDNWKIFENYKYCLVMENTKVDGYITEKLLLAFLGGCLPIYWGTEEVFDIFNEGAFLYYEPGVTVNDIVYLESNHSAYKERMSVPILAHGNDTVQKYFSLQDEVGGGVLKKRIRAMIGLS